jgi:hypothetical protein
MMQCRNPTIPSRTRMCLLTVPRFSQSTQTPYLLLPTELLTVAREFQEACACMPVPPLVTSAMGSDRGGVLRFRLCRMSTAQKSSFSTSKHVQGELQRYLLCQHSVDADLHSTWNRHARRMTSTPDKHTSPR